MRLLILQHDDDAPAALLDDWAAARGHPTVTVSVARLDRWPEPREFDAVVSLGSEASVYASPYAWIADELQFLDHTCRHEVPILGICFGAQMLAKVLGAEVRRAASMQVRWSEVRPVDTDLITPGPWFFWHSDCFGLPAGAQLLAGAGSQTTAFAAGRSLGLQFHPEADAAVVRGWIETGARNLAAAAIDRQRLAGEVAEQARGARARAFDLFDRIVAWWRSGSASLGLDRSATPGKERP